MKQKKSIFIVMLLFMGLVLAEAQVIPTGKLTGTVVDTEGGPLPGVNVSISSPSLILPQMVFVTTESGLYKFFNLPPGKYSVKFEMPGMKTVIREGIVISTAHTTTIDITMEQGPIDVTITVVGQSPTLDLEKTHTGTTITKEMFESLPLRRNLTDLFTLAPGMLFQSSHGSDDRSNNFLVDGVKMQVPVTGDPYLVVPYNSVDEIDVETSNQKAEAGTVKGAYVQVLTKSGGNDFSGDVNFYFRNKDLQSDNTKGTPLEGKTFVGFNRQLEPGFSLGGPIRKDKLWFFVSLNADLSQSFSQGFPAAPTMGGASVPSKPINSSFIQPFSKLTLQIDEKNKVVASGYMSPWYCAHRIAYYNHVEEATAEEKSLGALGTVQWSRVFTNNFFIDLKVSYYHFHQYLFALNDQPAHIDWVDNVTRGGLGWDWLGRNGRFSANGDATYFLDNWFGSHEFKGGVFFERASNYSEDRYYSDPHLEGVFPSGLYASEIELDNGVPQWAWVSTAPIIKSNITQLGAFIQDSWSPSKQFTINVGFRYDFAEGSFPPQKKSTGEWVNEKTIKALSYHMFSPRIGINYDPLGDGKTVLRASYGRYYSPLITLVFDNYNPNSYSGFSARLNPDWSVAYTTPPSAPSLNTIDKDISSPYADQVSFGVEREISEDISFAATFIGKWERNLMEDVDQAHVDIAKFKENGELVWSGYHPVTGTDPDTGSSVTFYEMSDDFGDYRFILTNVPGTSRKYRGLELKLTKRMSHNWAMQLSYVWSKGEGILNTSRDQSTGYSSFYDDPNVMINAFGRLENQREHQVKLLLTIRAPLGINLGVYYFFGTGIPYTKRIRTLEAGIGSLYQGVVSIFAEPRGSHRLPSQHSPSIRLEKGFNIWRGQLSFQLDITNLFNSNQTTSIGTTTGFDWQKVYGIMSPRSMKIGAVYKF